MLYLVITSSLICVLLILLSVYKAIKTDSSVKMINNAIRKNKPFIFFIDNEEFVFNNTKVSDVLDLINKFNELVNDKMQQEILIKKAHNILYDDTEGKI